MQTSINDKNYRFNKLTPMQQFHVMRRLSPLIFALGESASDTLLTTLVGSDLLLALEPMSEILAKMPDDDVEYVLNTCLSVVYRDEGTGFQRIQVQAGVMMFSDIDLSVMIKLVISVIKENLGNFFSALPVE
jgi:hypothetical protein